MRTTRSKRGISSLFFVVTCLALMIIGSLGIDVSHAFYARTQLQMVSDSAALTGAYYLCAPVPTAGNCKLANDYSRQIAARSSVDGTAVVDDGENTTMNVSYACKPGYGPHYCNIRLTRNVPTSLARMVGVMSLPISVESSAGAFMTSKAVMPNWLTNLAVSYRAASGVLNINTNDKENNGYLISQWQHADSPPVKFGITNVSAGPGVLNTMSTGVLYNVAVVSGGKEGEKMPTNSNIIGSTAIIIKGFQGPHKAQFGFCAWQHYP